MDTPIWQMYNLPAPVQAPSMGDGGEAQGAGVDKTKGLIGRTLDSAMEGKAEGGVSSIGSAILGFI